MTGTGVEEIWEGSEKIQHTVSKEGKKLFFCLETGPEISCIFQSPENPMGGGGGGGRTQP